LLLHLWNTSLVDYPANVETGREKLRPSNTVCCENRVQRQQAG
jgi:hypothetical protein